VPPPKKKRALTFLRWLIFLLIPIGWCALQHYELLDYFENRTVDWRFRQRGERPAPIKIVYVDIDTQALNEIGGWPWSRMYFSRVASALITEGGAKAVGIDSVFSRAGMSESVDWKKRVSGNVEFARTLSKEPPIVLAAGYAGQQFRDVNNRLTTRRLYRVGRDPRPLAKVEPPELPEFEISFDLDHPKFWSPPFTGLIDTIDEGTRYVPAYAPTLSRAYPHMAVELARLYWGLPPGAVKFEADRVEFHRADGGPQATIPLLHGQDIEVNWFSSWQSPYNPRISFSDVFGFAEMLNSEDAAEKEAAHTFFKTFSEGAFKDAVVLIGPVDPLMQDLGATPFDDIPVPKVGVHGNLLKTIISGQFLKRPAEVQQFAITLGLTLIVSMFAAAGGAKGLRSKLTAALLLTAYVFLAFQVFEEHNLILPLVAPLGAIFSTSFAAIAWQLIEEEKQKGRIKGMFGAYVSPDLVNRMVETGEDPQLGGHDAEITAYFSDIQGFSTFSEKLGSGPLVELMNEYLTACTDIVQEEGGTLDKYIGDAVVAMFGAPLPQKDHAYRACVATQRVHLKLAELRDKWRSQGEKWPEIVWQMQSRIGLNTGVCMIGNMGSRTRFNYTMMGDDVNLAARMESGAKSWGAYTMCTDTTKTACEQHGGDRVVFRPLGRIVVKGRTKAVPIFEIVGLKENVTPQTRECIEVFSQALERYYARDWDGALARFGKSRELEFNVPGKTPGVVSNPSLVYIDITTHYKHEPPPGNWDGVYVMKEK
jgi:adenylate cyclase